MGGKTLTRADLADAVMRKADLSRHEAQDLVERVLDEISDTLEKGETVKLSSFGSFGVREKSARIGRNPKTGEEKLITPRRVLVFRASNIMKSRVNRSMARTRAAVSGSLKGSGNGTAKLMTNGLSNRPDDRSD